MVRQKASMTAKTHFLIKWRASYLRIFLSAVLKKQVAKMNAFTIN